MKFEISEVKTLEYLNDNTSNVFFTRNAPGARPVRLSPQQIWQLFVSLENIDEEADLCWAVAKEKSKLDYSHHLGWGLYLTVLLYHGIRYYDIRRWWIPAGEDQPKATKIGIRFTVEELDKLKCFKTDLFAKMPELGLVEACDCFNGIDYLRCMRCNPFWQIHNRS